MECVMVYVGHGTTAVSASLHLTARVSIRALALLTRADDRLRDLTTNKTFHIVRILRVFPSQQTGDRGLKRNVVSAGVAGILTIHGVVT